MSRNQITMLVAQNIQAIIDRNGTDPAKLARAAGLNRTGIYDILKGKSLNPRLDTITKIADALGVPVGVLFEERDTDELKSEIISLVAGMSGEELQRTLVTIRAWAEMAQKKNQTSE